MMKMMNTVADIAWTMMTADWSTLWLLGQAVTDMDWEEEAEGAVVQPMQWEPIKVNEVVLLCAMMNSLCLLDAARPTTHIETAMEMDEDDDDDDAVAHLTAKFVKLRLHNQPTTTLADTTPMDWDHNDDAVVLLTNTFALLQINNQPTTQTIADDDMDCEEVMEWESVDDVDDGEMDCSEAMEWDDDDDELMAY
jgi:hypothetical protein